MLILVPRGVLESYRDIANATLQVRYIPDSWKREIMFLTEEIEGTEKVEKHRPIMPIEVCRKARTKILIKMTRKVWDSNNATSPRNTGF